jgi:hypothetical protein
MACLFPHLRNTGNTGWDSACRPHCAKKAEAVVVVVRVVVVPESRTAVHCGVVPTATTHDAVVAGCRASSFFSDCQI